MNRLSSLLMVMMITAASAHAQTGLGLALPGGNAKAARPLVAEHCIKCHAVPGFPKDRIQPAVKAPAFETIANNPQAYPEKALRAFLRKPHYPMQGFVLSKRDIDNIIAFLHTLRRK